MKGYTLAQVEAFTRAAVKFEKRRNLDMLAVVRVAVNGDKAAVKKLEKSLGG